MATVTGLTAARMTTMENNTVISGSVVGGNLILVTKGGTQINAGPVTGPTGPAGPTFVVCTSTTRPTYSAAEQGKAIYETDTKFVRIWTGARFRLQERIICTSTTRPTGLVSGDEGTKIYETDSNLEFVWTGTAWFPAFFPARFATAAARSSAWPSPADGSMSYLDTNPTMLWTYYGGVWHSPAALGMMHYDSNSIDTGISNGNTIDAPVATYSGTPPAGRKIKVTAQAQIAMAAGAGSCGAKALLTSQAGAVLIQRDLWILGNGYYTDVDTVTLIYTITSTGAALSFKLRIQNVLSDPAQALVLQDSLILVEDVGGT